VRSSLSKTAEAQGVTEFTARFLFSEWTYVVDAWQLDTIAIRRMLAGSSNAALSFDPSTPNHQCGFARPVCAQA
jgi:hypothetical protein